MICIWSSWCHCHLIIFCSSKMQNGLPFWCRLTQVVLEKRPLNGCSSSLCCSTLVLIGECVLWHCWLSGRKGIWSVKKLGDGGGGHWLTWMEWRPAGWSVCRPLLIFPCTIKSRSSLLAPAHPGGPGKRAVKWLWCGGECVLLFCFSIPNQEIGLGNVSELTYFVSSGT